MKPVMSHRSVGRTSLLKSKFRPVPGVFLKKYFGCEDFKVKGAKRQVLTRNFLVKHLKVRPNNIKFDENGGLLLDKKAKSKITEGTLTDSSFLLNGGRAEAVYENVEMAYNDVMVGTVEAGGDGLMSPVRGLARKIGRVLPESIKDVAKGLRDSGSLDVLTGLGAGGAVGVGLWLGYSGARQVTQGVARGDSGQVFQGARRLFLGSESLVTASAMATKVSSNALLQTAGAAAIQLTAPLTLVHSAIDLVEGAGQLKEGIKNKDSLSALEGVAGLGTGAGWAMVVGFGATPALVAVCCACLAGKLAVSAVRHRRQKKEQKELVVAHEESRADQSRHLAKIGDKNIQLPADSSLTKSPWTLNAPHSDANFAIIFTPSNSDRVYQS